MGSTRQQTGTILNDNGRNGRSQDPADDFEELGTPGISSVGGFISEAYVSKLQWPGVAETYSRIWRADAETTIVRNWITALSGTVRLRWELPEDREGRMMDPPTDDDRKLLDFAWTLGEDVEGGLLSWLIHCMGRVSFYGWGWWETPLAVRNPVWVPPGDSDPWRSKFDDNLVGLRRLAFRNYSSLYQWDLDDKNGRLRGMEQNDPPNTPIVIPLDNSLHVTYGDSQNPEGVATLEAIYRLERIKYALEIVLGTGFEHTAGHVKFKVSETLGADEKAMIRRAAKAILSAQQGNYITEIDEKFSSDIMDVNFQAAPSLLEAIRYFGILKLTLYGMQYVAMSSISGTGSYSALTDSSSMAMLIFNSMKNGFVEQFNRQIGTRVLTHPVNAAAFPGATRIPRLVADDVSKGVELESLSQFVQTFASLLPLSDDDVIAIRSASGILPETIPEDRETAVSEEDEEDGGDPQEPEGVGIEGEAEDGDGDFGRLEGWTEFQRDAMTRPDARIPSDPFLVPEGDEPTAVADEIITEDDVDEALERFMQWASENEPIFEDLLNATEEETAVDEEGN